MTEGEPVESIHCDPLSETDTARIADALDIEYSIFPNGEILVDCHGAVAGPYTADEFRGIVEGVDYQRDRLIDAGALSVEGWANSVGARSAVQ